MKQPLVQAYVIHRRRYGDNSLLMEFFTPTDGRIAVIARGAASGKSARKALLQPFVPLLANWVGRGEVKTLCKLEASSDLVEIAGRRLFCGFYVNELIMRLTQRHDACQELFEVYAQALLALASEKDVELVLRRFEIDMLAQLGYALELTRETASGAPIAPHDYYTYQVENGVVQSSHKTNNAIQGATLLALSDKVIKLDQKQKMEARGLIRRVLQFYLGDKPLKSRELF